MLLSQRLGLVWNIFWVFFCCEFTVCYDNNNDNDDDDEDDEDKIKTMINVVHGLCLNISINPWTAVIKGPSEYDG